MPAPAPFPRIPELAGLATYGLAARTGATLEQGITALLGFHWVERRLMAIALGRLPATPEWEVKCALALHQWHSAEHANALRERIGELRDPLPDFDTPPTRALDTFFAEVAEADDTVELLAGLYRVAHPALADAYRRHVATIHPLLDHPTGRLLRPAIVEVDDAVVWGARAISAFLAGDPRARRRAEEWESHLRAYLTEARGIAGDGVLPRALPSRYDDDVGGMPAASRSLPARRSAAGSAPDVTPRRDSRFASADDAGDFTPLAMRDAPDVPDDERVLASLAVRALSMESAETLAGMLTERPGLPWGFHLDHSRQLWDAARDAMMGTVALARGGIDWTRLPLNAELSRWLALHATAAERQRALVACNDADADAGTPCREAARATGNELAERLHDYDVADQMLRARIAGRWREGDDTTMSDVVTRAREIRRPTSMSPGGGVATGSAGWWRALVERALDRRVATGTGEDERHPLPDGSEGTPPAA